MIGVTADGNLGLKSFYSSYGTGSAQVVAPGGDSILQLTAAAPNGRVARRKATYDAAVKVKAAKAGVDVTKNVASGIVA